MNDKSLKMLRKAGFIFWAGEPWRPQNAVIDWATEYDKEVDKLMKSVEKKLAKRDREIARLKHELAKLKTGAIEVHHHIDFDAVYAEVDKERPA
jgi:hypothetical protein